MSFETLTNRDILDADTELGIWITTNPEENTLTIRDSGVGMTREELAENLGTIAHSGARAFLKVAQEMAAKDNTAPISEIIGQFGVGFCAAFMVAESIRVTSRSFRANSEAATWFSHGEDTFTLEPAEIAERGTVITVKLKEDASEFTQESKLSEVIKKHSDFIPYPIYLGEEKKQVNQRTALWRQSPREVKPEEYEDFYRQFTLDFEPPLSHGHMVVDAPVQLYALLFIPTSPEKSVFSLRKEEGLKLYARKVLIQEYSRDLLPEYFRFVQGVVDSEDLQLNVSRESIQSSRVMAQIRRALVGKVLEMLRKLASEPAKQGDAETEAAPNRYAAFWKTYGRFIKEGIAMAGGPSGERDALETLPALLRYHTLNRPGEWVALDDYIQALKPEQKKIYYILGDDERAIARSPHLDLFRHGGVDVLLMTDPLDPVHADDHDQIQGLRPWSTRRLKSLGAAEADGQPETEIKEEPLAETAVQGLVQRFKDTLGARVTDVRVTDRLIDSPAGWWIKKARSTRKCSACTRCCARIMTRLRRCWKSTRATPS